MEFICQVCGNEVEPDTARCPFCDAKLKFSPSRQSLQHKIIKLKQGMPTVEQALARLDRELEQARLERCRILTLVHGYGSTGHGGAIRKEIRNRLQYFAYRKKINGVLFGEDFSTGNGPGYNLLRRFPFLRQHQDLNRGNRGITLVIL